ncbi:hypothetical protein BMETH_1527_0 [methanotrophic bacterial endosymbiont of Bathymodiolus sp.]|nr:hypothetical protein BMETH_1527_0 [methanotrophic bacterial endosymbiont of Bathymodiolus sp.]
MFRRGNRSRTDQCAFYFLANSFNRVHCRSGTQCNFQYLDTSRH